MIRPSWISPLAEPAIEPERVERALLQLEAAWPADLPPLPEVVAGFVDGGVALAHLLSVSPVSAAKLFADPAALVWLAQPEIHHITRGPRRMQAAYDEVKLENFDQSFRGLRRVKAREMLRIALREVAGWSSVELTTLELTHLAEICLRVVCKGWMEELSKRLGRPQTDFAILGMGKYGGQELNYSSDIDVIFFYGDDGHVNSRLTNQEFFARLAEKIIATFSANDAVGPLFRIDLRLRPEGASGPLVRSLDSMENYYSGFGETWERMALIKARVVAGTDGGDELGYEFAHRLQPFIFPRAVSLEVVEEIRAIKGRIEREIVGQAKLRRNVKLGYGGIREIEFVAQTLQILHASRHAFLQERGTLKTLTNLQQLNIIPRQDMETLITAYRFLRTVEHRLQIENEAQTHTLPEREEDLARLAASLAESGVPGFAPKEGDSRRPGADVLHAELKRQTEAVRAIFDRVLARPDDRESDEEAGRDLSFFQEPAHAAKVLEELAKGPSTVLVSPRTRRIYARLEPLLLENLRVVADPDGALNRFVRFVERYGLRGMLFETLVRSPRVLDLLVRLFDSSEFMTEIALRRPQLIEEVAREGLGKSLDVRGYLAGLASNDEKLPWQDWVRAYRRAQILRIGLRDVLGLVTLRELQAEYSALAEACLLFAQRELGLENELTIIAMGKFGGAELVYGADLDVVFLGQNLAGAAAIMRAMSAHTAEGSVFAVDARLRPEGDAGQLATPLSAYETYFEGRAQVWEGQALTKARVISGPQKAEAEAAIRRIWERFGTRPDLVEQIASMHARIVRDRAGAADAADFKTGTGGLMQVEFFSQCRQMHSGTWQPNTLDALQALAANNELDRETSDRLRDAYGFLRKVESVLRRMEDSSNSRLPADELAQKQLAMRCGFSKRDKFLAAVQAARHTISELARIA